jgi:Transposase IS66 family
MLRVPNWQREMARPNSLTERPIDFGVRRTGPSSVSCRRSKDRFGVRLGNGLSPEQRVAVRCRDIAPLVDDLIDWMKRERGKLSRHNEVAKAMDYMLKRIEVFTLPRRRPHLPEQQRRKSWLFAAVACSRSACSFSYCAFKVARAESIASAMRNGLRVKLRRDAGFARPNRPRGNGRVQRACRRALWELEGEATTSEILQFAYVLKLHRGGAARSEMR